MPSIVAVLNLGVLGSPSYPRHIHRNMVGVVWSMISLFSPRLLRGFPELVSFKMLRRASTSPPPPTPPSILHTTITSNTTVVAIDDTTKLFLLDNMLGKLDEERISNDRRLQKLLIDPFWGYLWPGSYALHKHIREHGASTIKHRNVLDFASGCGLSAITASRLEVRSGQTTKRQSDQATKLQSNYRNALIARSLVRYRWSITNLMTW